MVITWIVRGSIKCTGTLDGSSDEIDPVLVLQALTFQS